MFHKYKKGFISLFLALSVMLSCCVPVFAKITTTETDTYIQTKYENEPVTPYNLWIGKGGDFMYRTGASYYSYSFELATITKVVRSSDSSIRSITINITDSNFLKITDNTSSFTLTEYKDLHDNSIVINSSSYSSTCYKLNIDKIMVSTSLDVVNGETFTYLDHAGNEKTITFDGNGGIVGGFDIDGPDDNPFGDLTEEEYPDFNLPEYTGKDISEYVDFESIIDSIQGLDVVGAVTGVLNALKGGFQYITHSVINIVSHLALTLVSLFDWLKETLPILFGNMVVKLNPYFENLYNALKLVETAVKSNPVGEFVFDEEGLFGKLDEMLTTIKNFLTEQIFNALMVIPDIKTAIELWFTAIETSFSDTLTKLSNLYDSLVAFKDNALSSIQNIITDIKNLPNEISDKLIYLFIPSENYFENKMNSFKEFTLSTVFMEEIVSPVQNSISSAVNDRSAPAFSFEIFNSQCEMTFEPIAPVISMTDPIIIFICYFFGLKHLLFSFLNLISTIKTERGNA